MTSKFPEKQGLRGISAIESFQRHALYINLKEEGGKDQKIFLNERSTSKFLPSEDEIWMLHRNTLRKQTNGFI